MYPVLRAAMLGLAHSYLAGCLHVEGRHLVPRSGGLLVISNHIATVDPPLTGALLPRLDVHYMTKSDSFTGGAVNRLFHAYNAFPVQRGSADRSSLTHALDLLAAGHVVMVYPEGSRSADAQLSRPHPGVGFLARRSAAAVLPAAIWGSERVLPKGANFPVRAPVTIRFGRPFRPVPEEAGGRLSNQQMADAMMWRVADLLPPGRRGVFVSAESVAAAVPPRV